MMGSRLLFILCFVALSTRLFPYVLGAPKGWKQGRNVRSDKINGRPKHSFEQASAPHWLLPRVTSTPLSFAA
jgi:hypothetical protein